MKTTVATIVLTCILWPMCVADQVVEPSTTAAIVASTNSKEDGGEPRLQSVSSPSLEPIPQLNVTRTEMPKFGIPMVKLEAAVTGAENTTVEDKTVEDKTAKVMPTKKTTESDKQITGVNKEGSFAVDMIRPFGKSTIRYSYTELRGSRDTTPEPERNVPSDQAYSVSVSPYDCGGGKCDRRKRKRRPVVTTDQSNGEIQSPTNTILPLAKFPGINGVDPSKSRPRRVFEVAADQLELLYTVQRRAVDAAETTASPVQVTNR